MGSILFPAALVVLFFIAAAVRHCVLRMQRPRWLVARLRRRDGRGERAVGATATEELHALLYPTKRVQLEQRRIELVLRDDEHDCAPPRTTVDLAAGTATFA
ncbi:DUF6191 domain-containing protein [Embleya sp. NPDC050154]|uniref:DUF6191 domain-containing protein n=1 Tax=Embleya sp. NPDC050154 TaxID=3363988 RepID=UPI0037A4BC42